MTGSGIPHSLSGTEAAQGHLTLFVGVEIRAMFRGVTSLRRLQDLSRLLGRYFACLDEAVQFASLEQYVSVQGQSCFEIDIDVVGVLLTH
jgi:hypothetical protein